MSALLDLYKNVRAEILEREKNEYAIPLSYFGVAAAIFSLVLTLAKLVETSPKYGTWPLFVPCLLVSLLSMVGYYQFTMHSRTVAVLQGYGAYLENEINKILSLEVAMHYSSYIDNFLVPEKFLTNRLSIFLMMPLLFLVNAGAFVLGYLLLTDTTQWIIYIAVGVLFLGGMVVLVTTNMRNDIIRKQVTEFQKQGLSVMD